MKKEISVVTGIGGSHCVVFLDSQREHYIDAKKDRRAPDTTTIECVSNGRVLSTIQGVPDKDAPAYICAIMHDAARKLFP